MSSYGVALEMREAALSVVKQVIKSRAVDHEIGAWIDTAKGLIAAVPVFWSSECADAVTAAAPSFNIADTVCARSLFFVDCAFIWFERPFFSILVGDRQQPVLALQWQCEQDKAGRSMLSLIHYVACEIGPLPVMWASMRFGESMADTGHDQAGLVVTDEFRSEQSLSRQWLIAANVFVRQRLVADDEIRAERGFRRRLPAEVADQLIHVIRLRAMERGSKRGADCEWQHQWIVSGHVRRQWYPSIGEHLPVWISPYLKGPEDKPFKQRTEPLILVNR